MWHRSNKTEQTFRNLCLSPDTNKVKRSRRITLLKHRAHVGYMGSTYVAQFVGTLDHTPEGC